MNPQVASLGKKHSLKKVSLNIEHEEDIEEEIKRRKEEAINKSAEVRRRSAAAPLIAGLSASELNQHCRDCIKLSTENKINTKNAFSFLLIDAMAAMAKKADSEISKNFQVASCTLDASVKIYGYRVDAVHADTIKMAGGVLSKEVEKEEGNVENGEEENEDELKKDKKSWKKKKKKYTIAPPETLNGKNESDFLMDLTPHQSFLSRKTDGNDLLIKIPKRDDGNVLYINSEYPCWPYGGSKSKVPPVEREEVLDSGCLRAMLKKIDITKEDHFCPTYHKFTFGGDPDDDANSDKESLSPSPRKSDCFEFDINASVEDVPMEEDVEDIEKEPLRTRLQIPLGGYESDQEIQLPAIPEQKASKKVSISDLKSRITLDPLEYSMFDAKVLKAWAGPSYWKILPERKPSSDDNKENDASKAVASKRTRKGRVKSSVDLFDVNESDLAKFFTVGEKTMLNKSTMLNWSPQNVTMPRDCMYKTKNFFTLFHLPHINLKLKEDEARNQLEVLDVREGEENEELDYCSNLSMQGDAHNLSNEEENGVQEGNDIAAGTNEMWDEKNMVAVPNRVEKIYVSAFKRKKNVDIKQLKKSLWNMLTSSGSGDGVEKDGNSEEKISKPVLFSDITKMYNAKMPKHMTPSLSVPLIFNALLHLTNEKCLILKQDESNGPDFTVFQ